MKKMMSLLIIFLILNSCNDLDLLPLDRVTTTTFYQTKDDFDGAIFAAYSSIQDFWGTSTETLSERGEFWKITMTITDDVTADLNASDQISRDIDNLFIRASDVPFAAIYTQIYEGILRANLVIENLEEENQLTTEEKSALEGEAKFLRAFFHFQALKMFGTPPLATTVKTDLNDLALAAVIAFQEVVDMGPYLLQESYEDVFAFDNENNSESIFEIQYGGPFSDDNLWVFDDTHSENFKATQGTGRGYYWDASSENGAPGNKQGWWVPTQDLVDAYEPDDERLATNIYRQGDMYYTTFTSLPYDPSWSTSGFTLKKYRGQRNIVPANHAPNEQADFNNERWFRFAELKLLYAEALLETGNAGEATNQINEIRGRAGLDPLVAAATMDDLQREKRLEMAFEPHRWFDIVRWGIGPQVFGAAWDAKFEVFPFPQSEVDRSGGLLEQNFGY